MKTLNFLFCLAFSFGLKAKPDTIPVQNFIHGNNIEAWVNSNGMLFGDSERGLFFTDDSTMRSPIRIAGLWLAGTDPGGNLKGAIQMYNEDGKRDFLPGMVGEESHILNDVWKISKSDIEDFFRDYFLDWTIDDPTTPILSWPSKGNPHFKNYFDYDLPNTRYALAHFWDEDGDGLYNPLRREYPTHVFRGLDNRKVFEELIWFAYHDSLNHTFSEMKPLPVEIQTMVGEFSCGNHNTLVHNSVLVRYKIINKSNENIEQMYFGQYVDFQLGCPNDDYLGVSPELNTFYVYNSDNFDEDCENYEGYGENPPVMAVRLIRGPLDEFRREIPLSHIMLIPDSTQNNGIKEPTNGGDFHNYMRGFWTDNTALTHGGNGYNPVSTDTTNFIYSGNPTDMASWSEIALNNIPGRRRAVATYGPFLLQPGAVNEMIVAYTFLRGDGFTNLENVQLLHDTLENVFAFAFDNHFPQGEPCTGGLTLVIPVDTSDITAPLIDNFDLFPNPAQTYINIRFQNPELVEFANIYDPTGKLVLPIKPAKKVFVNVESWTRGVYFLSVKLNGKIRTKPFLVMRE